MSSSSDCEPFEARGSDDDLREFEIFLVEDSQSVAVTMVEKPIGEAQILQYLKPILKRGR
jgi:hypothetical protein